MEYLHPLTMNYYWYCFVVVVLFHSPLVFVLDLGPPGMM